MIEPKLSARQQCPKQLSARLGFAVLPAGDVLAEQLPFLGRRGSGQHAAHLVVLLGMVLLLGAVVLDGTRHAANRRQEGFHRDALR